MVDFLALWQMNAWIVQIKNSLPSICTGWIPNYKTTLGLYAMDAIGANSPAFSIKDVLLRMNLPLSNCRGQCYDGASNMSGIRGGVSTQLTATEKQALFTHCYCHALNFAISDTIKQSKICPTVLEVAFEITKLVKFSPKRNAIFDRI